MVEALHCSAKLKLMPVGGQKVKVSFSPRKVWLLSVQQCHIGLMKRRGHAVVAKKNKKNTTLQTGAFQFGCEYSFNRGATE